MRKERKFKKQKVDETIISSISSPNAWTEADEEEWLKQPAFELRKRFPPMSKPRHVNYIVN
jgi:hypothetical protein